MPATEFSEFTYGYAVMRETETFLTKHAGALTRAPEQPSLIKENTVGYDAKFVTVDFAVLLQFKVPFFTSRQHSRGACGPDHCTWSAWRREHFRVWVDVGSNQQSAMREYEREIDSGAYLGLSCYVTPAYWKQRGHDSHYARGFIHSNRPRVVRCVRSSCRSRRDRRFVDGAICGLWRVVDVVADSSVAAR